MIKYSDNTDITPHTTFTFFKYLATPQTVPIHFWPC